MIYEPGLLDYLGALSLHEWHGIVFRHIFGTNPPERENIVGARWNPPNVPAIYSSLSFEGAKAEADYRISLQPTRPGALKASRTIYEVDVALQKVLGLADWSILEELGVDRESFDGFEPVRCREIGGAAAELLHADGLLVPSARADNVNLVIFPTNQTPGYQFSVSNSIPINEH
jgi:RES domain-containing protein